MRMVEVASSNIAAVGWEGGTLRVEFASGDVWLYRGVPREIFAGLLGAVSKGAYFQARIRGKYQAEAE